MDKAIKLIDETFVDSRDHGAAYGCSGLGSTPLERCETGLGNQVGAKGYFND